MSRTKILSALICAFILIFGVSVVLSVNWNKVEGASNVTEYASDSGSFALMEGYEFVKIGVGVSLQDGESEEATMHSEAYISLDGGSCTVYQEVESTTDFLLQTDYSNPQGLGYDGCNNWYWSVDTRNNDGTGTAWCKWAWLPID